jgi:hypothetical protein
MNFEKNGDVAVEVPVVETVVVTEFVMDVDRVLEPELLKVLVMVLVYD